MGPEVRAQRENDHDLSGMYSLDRLNQLTSEELLQLAARRLSDYNEGRDGVATGAIRFTELISPHDQIQSDSKDEAEQRIKTVTPVTSIEPDLFAPDFVRHLLTSPLTPSILKDAFQHFPARRAALYMVRVLIHGGRADRDMVLDSFFELAKSDTEPGAAEVHLWMVVVFGQMLTYAVGSERDHWIAGLGDLLRYGSKTFFKGIQFNLLERSQDKQEHAWEAYGKIDALLSSKLPQAYCAVLACAASTIVTSKVKTYALTKLVNEPFPGTPALNQFLRNCMSEFYPDKRTARLKMLAAAGGFLAEYWGPLALWAIERPLRLAAEQGRDILKVYEGTCHKISPAAFLFAYNLAEGNREILSSLDRSLRSEDLTDVEYSWMSRQLKHALIRASFLSPFQHVQCQTSVKQIDPHDEVGHQLLLNAIDNASLKQSEELPHMEAHRRIAFSGAGLAEQRLMLSALPAHISPDISSPEIQRYLSVDPFLTAQQQVSALTDHRSELQSRIEDTTWYTTYTHLAEDCDRTWFSPSSARPSSLRQFVRAQTIHNEEAPPLLAALSEAFGQTIPTGELKKWAEWRYNTDDPKVARQLRSLSPKAQAEWAVPLHCMIEGEPVGGAIPLVELEGQSRYIVMATDDPLWLFNLGVIPRVSSACTAFDGGSYYSKNTVSFVVDAHIQGLVVLDHSKILKDLAPQMTQVNRDELQAGQLSNRLIRAQFHHLAKAVVARSMVKLVEDLHGNPLLMMEPVFINGSHEKNEGIQETVVFTAVLARKYRAGFCVAPYDNETRFPKTHVVLPPSRSPGGQIENHDLLPWLSSHHGATVINAIEILPPPQRGATHPFWRDLQ